MPNAKCLTPDARCPMLNAQYPMPLPNAQCPMPDARCPMPISLVGSGLMRVHTDDAGADGVPTLSHTREILDHRPK